MRRSNLLRSNRLPSLGKNQQSGAAASPPRQSQMTNPDLHSRFQGGLDRPADPFRNRGQAASHRIEAADGESPLAAAPETQPIPNRLRHSRVPRIGRGCPMLLGVFSMSHEPGPERPVLLYRVVTSDQGVRRSRVWRTPGSWPQTYQAVSRGRTPGPGCVSR